MSPGLLRKIRRPTLLQTSFLIGAPNCTSRRKFARLVGLWAGLPFGGDPSGQNPEGAIWAAATAGPTRSAQFD